jgi:DNA-binding transcriptional regulator YdaS (Cro superfamily)
LLYSLAIVIFLNMKKTLQDVPNLELAEFLGATPGWSSQLKTGHRKVPANKCLAISKHFDISLHALRPDIFPADYPLHKPEKLGDEKRS